MTYTLTLSKWQAYALRALFQNGRFKYPSSESQSESNLRGELFNIFSVNDFSSRHEVTYNFSFEFSETEVDTLMKYRCRSDYMTEPFFSMLDHLTPITFRHKEEESLTNSLADESGKGRLTCRDALRECGSDYEEALATLS